MSGSPEDEEGLKDGEYDKFVYTEELVYGSQKKLAPVYSGMVFTKQQLAEHGYALHDNNYVTRIEVLIFSS